MYQFRKKLIFFFLKWGIAFLVTSYLISYLAISHNNGKKKPIYQKNSFNEVKEQIFKVASKTNDSTSEKIKEGNLNHTRESRKEKNVIMPAENKDKTVPLILPFYSELEEMQNLNATSADGFVVEVPNFFETCEFDLDYPENATPVDIQMLDLYRYLQFNNREKQIEIEFDKDDFNEDSILKVFVVPHSHNDAGWLKTFDDYFSEDTESILMNMVLFLSENPEMKFIWAEVSFFAKFFEKLSADLKQKVINLVKWNKLEFVTGGWVMPDEANTHWYSILIQLMEGQKWLLENLNVTPVSSWAIDSFGHSSTIPYLLKKSGFQNLLIQRAHHAVKRYLAEETSLEFYWRQFWDISGTAEMFTHMMPYKDYTTSHACGPDFEICNQFDFMVSDKLLRQFAGDIDEKNIAKKSNLLLNQWRKQSTLFKTKSLIMPLGDYLSYKQMAEFQGKYENYEKIFHFINTKHDLFTKVKFSTLQEFFESVRSEYVVTDFPVLSGDFFTYSDQKNDYWSGYYTTRPFQKVMERILLHYVKSAEMLRIWHDWGNESEFDEKLEYARRQLSLIQHHEAITGTSKNDVVNDFEKRMINGIENCKYIIQHASYRLLTEPSNYHPNFRQEFFTVDLEWSGPNTGLTIELKKNSIVVFQNSLPQWREEFVDVYVPQPFVLVTDSKNNKINAQISLVWNWNKGWFSFFTMPHPDPKKFKLTFKIKVPPLGLTTYHIEKIKNDTINPYTSFSNTTILTHMPYNVNLTESMNKVNIELPTNFSIKTAFGATAYFDSEGMMQSVCLDDSDIYTISLEFIKYRNTKTNPSGAYIFSSNGIGTKLALHSPTILVTEGELESTVSVGLPFVVHTVLLREDIGIEIRNFIDISDKMDIEISMKVRTGINNNDIFYTDLNGFQIVKRRRLSELPLQGNLYPIPSNIFIEDEKFRFTILTAQPLGGTSSEAGQIEIMQDRRLSTDDKKGLNQNILDNKPIQLKFRLLIEQRHCVTRNPDYPGSFLSSYAYKHYQRLLSPLNNLYWKKENWTGSIHRFGESHQPLANDMEIATLKTLEYNNEIGVIIHRTYLDTCNDENTKGKLNFKKLLGLKKDPAIYSTQLTLLKKLARVPSHDTTVCPMDIKAYIIKK